jgi:hypothetical protein
VRRASIALASVIAAAIVVAAPHASADGPVIVEVPAPPPTQPQPPPAAPAPAPTPAPSTTRPPGEDEEPPPKKPGKSRFIAKVGLGAAYRRIFSVPIYAGELGISLGGGNDKMAFFFDINAMLGRTEYHLQSGQFDIGGSIEGNFAPAHLGFNLHLSYMYIARTTSSATMDSLGVGIAPFFLVDVVPFDGNALYLGVRVPLDLYNGSPAPGVWGITGMLGIRF